MLSMKTATAVQQDQNRADYMEYLYGLYGRGNPDVENRYTYTGLFQHHVELVGADIVQAQVEWFHEDGEAICLYDAEISAKA
jgi:hypothetical protein